ncbi:MAG: ABC transporter permease [Planctomycetota bacterium]
MADGGSASTGPLGTVRSAGRAVLAPIEHAGTVVVLAGVSILWIIRALVSRDVRLGLGAISGQVVRVGVRSMFIVALVSGSVGLILTLQLEPPLNNFGQRDAIARILGVAVLRELGPLIGAIVLTGFAGAAIAAELGTMVVSEEIEALEAHAIDPVRFLVVPRIIATTVSMTVLAVLADFMAIVAGLGISTLALGVSIQTFLSQLLAEVGPVDFITGVIKGTIFGIIIGLIACRNGLRVSGGAEGVGNATTQTVVQCVVAIVIADLVFTAIFYAFELF